MGPCPAGTKATQSVAIGERRNGVQAGAQSRFPWCTVSASVLGRAQQRSLWVSARSPVFVGEVFAADGGTDGGTDGLHVEA